MKKWIWFLFKLLVFGCILYGIYSYLAPESPVHTVTLDQKETVLNHTTAELQEIVIGESRRTSELIVFEQDLSVTQEIRKALFDWEIFEKTQTVTSYGTALYVTDLSGISETDLSFDEITKTMTIAVPHSRLKSVSVDVEKTEFSDVSRNLLGWGDIKLTPEQQNILQQDLQAALEEEASRPAYFAKADESAVLALHDLFQKAFQSAGEEIALQIIFQE